ncbi:alpha/beta hydrolase [Aquihabitans sp. G128]|uniref:alpha/beta fold hydrolase n=1 Tax=Aquihabitans sp. G128 TaxID=2849779 RepID=UPI001C20F7EC|nr:alpha/beta fold hydrolase [Aquihabitans sp. G128]QXC62205.1 alpha/beta hydrolase [Aquihabitans sp. G128]
MLVPSGSARIAYDAEGAGAPVLLLHAGVTDRRSWRPLVDHLGGGFRTIAYDRRGFGETTYDPEPHREADGALAVLDAEGVGSAAVVGASNGGRRAIDLALAAPDRVDALVLIGAGVSGAPELEVAALAPDVQDLVARYEAAEEAGDLDLVNRLEAHAWLDGWTAPEGRVGEPVRARFLEANDIALRSPDPGPEDPVVPAWDRLGEITVPTLVLCGEHDVVAVPAAEHLAAHIPGARYEVLAGTGHLPHVEGHPEALRLITELLEAVGP